MTTLPKPPQTVNDAIKEWPVFAHLHTTPQDPTHHGEGDVAIHTQMVLNALRHTPQWNSLTPEDQTLLQWTALFHDLGKIHTTKLENGKLTSRGHSRAGAAMTRHLLWEWGMPTIYRHKISALIQRHQLPFWLIERENAAQLTRIVSLETSWNLLLTHAYADALGRTCLDQNALLTRIQLAELLAQENQCLNAPYPYPNKTSMIGDIHHNRSPDWEGHTQDTPFEFALMCGPPGAGKDTYIHTTLNTYSVISLDAMRKTKKIAPDAHDGALIQEAREQLRTALRKKQNVVWNATSLTQDLRTPLLGMARDYGARTKIICLEPAWDVLWERNKKRGENGIPNKKLQAMIERYDPPKAWEAHELIVQAAQ